VAKAHSKNYRRDEGQPHAENSRPFVFIIESMVDPLALEAARQRHRFDFGGATKLGVKSS